MPPAGLTRAKACASHGTVRVRYLSRAGKRDHRRATRRVRLSARCTFRSHARFRTGARRAAAKVRFTGNEAMRARSARKRITRIR